MKFLGIRNGHDCNVTYTDGNKVHYLKPERNLQIKHYDWRYDTPNAVLDDDMARLLDFAKVTLNIDFKDLDAICIDPSPDRHKVNDYLEPWETSKYLSKQKNPFWSDFSCPIWLLSHHAAHAYSTWPIIDTEHVETHIVVDGEGDFNRHTSVFDYGYVINDYVDYRESLGISKILEQTGIAHGIKGMRLDVSGKTMALKSFHTMHQNQIDEILYRTRHMSYRHMTPFLEYCQNYLNQLNKPSQEALVDFLYLVHMFGEQKLPAFFEQHSTFGNVTYSGGTAQNTCINTEIKKKIPNLYIPPHCPDDGISLGCVEFLRQTYQQDHFQKDGFPYWQSDEAPKSRPSQQTIDTTAELLAKGKIVGWYQGHGEIGPRALGNRSILMDPSIKNGKDIINSKVKRRESYRPFGASVLWDKTNRHFNCDYQTPYMLYVIDCLNDDFPAIMHVDKTCRIQTVEQSTETEDYYNLIETFEQKTGIPLLLNTSLNVDGKPIAAKMSDAKELFNNSELDVVVIGNEIITK